MIGCALDFLVGEYLPKIERCLAELSTEQIWWRPNSESNSIGNLVLHMCGNARQWIVAGVGGVPDTRTRDAEFARTSPIERSPVHGVTMFLVPAGAPGVTIREIDTFGIHGMSTCEIFYDDVIVPEDASLSSEWRKDLLGGTQAIVGRVAAVHRVADGVSTDERAHDLVAIPYHRWSNRWMGEMAVWLPQTRDSAWIAPVPPAPIRLVRSSGEARKTWTGYNDQNSDIGALYDGRDPLSSADESYRYVRVRPTPGTPAWMEYELTGPTRLSCGASTSLSATSTFPAPMASGCSCG